MMLAHQQPLHVKISHSFSVSALLHTSHVLTHSQHVPTVDEVVGVHQAPQVTQDAKQRQ